MDAIRLLAEVGISIGSIGEAILLLERCLELAPEFHVARSNYVTALSRHQRFDEALAENEQLREAKPNNLAHQVQFATTLSMAGRFEPAHGEFVKVLEQAPDNERILTSYGHSLRYGGKGEEAIAIYLRAIEAEPSAGEAYWSLANLKTFRFDDTQLKSMQSQLGALAQPSDDKTHLAFAVGKALEDREAYDPSFAAYAEGNAISLTVTLNGSYGSGVVAEKFGISLNNEMDDFSAKTGVPNAYGLIGGKANAVAPGKRPLSSMTPTIVFKDARPFLATGSPGGRRIPHYLSRVLLAALVWNELPHRAVALPHLSMADGDLVIERDAPLAWPIDPEPLLFAPQALRSQPFGSGTALLQRINGSWHGAADPRREGTAVALP